MHNVTDVGRGWPLVRRFSRFLVVVVLISICLAGCRHGRAIERGDELFLEGKYDQALVAYEEALEAKPESDQAVAGIAESRRQIVLQFVEQGQRALGDEDYLVALDYWSRASEVPGEFSELQRLGRDLQTEVTSAAETAVKANEYAFAMQIYERFFESGLPGSEDFDERIAEVAHDWAGRSARLGTDMLERGYEGYGLLLFAHASSLSSEETYHAMRDQIWRRMQPTLVYRVRVNSEGNRGLEGWSGPEIGEDHDTVIRVFRDMGDRDDDAIVRVQKLSPVIVHRESRRVEHVEYQSGTREVSNPYYEELESRIYRAQRRLTDVERDVTQKQSEVSRRQLELERVRARESDESSSRIRQALRDLERAHQELERAYRDVNDAREKVQRARDQVNRTSRTVEEPVYSIYTFPVITHTSEGMLDVDLVIQHADGREAIHVSKSLQIDFSDYEHDAHPVIDLGRKYVDIPSDQVIEDQLKHAATRHIVDGMERSLESYRASVLAHARQSQDSTAKLDGLVRYLLLAGAEARSDLNEEIFAMTGIPATHRVLLNLRD